MRALAVALLLLLMAIVPACARGPGSAYYADLLESLAVPIEWEPAHTARLDSCFAVSHCPRAHRYYFVSGSPEEHYNAAKQLLTDAGYEIDLDFAPSCDPDYSGGYIGWACTVHSRKGDDFLSFHLYEPGRDPNNLGIAREGVSMAELRASYSPLAEPPPPRPAARAAHYVAVVESLGIPAGWELAYERQKEPSGEVPCVISSFGVCPAAHRYYYVDIEPGEAYAAVKQLMLDAGFEVTAEHRPACDGIPESDLACWLSAAREADAVDAYVFKPGHDAEQLGIGREGFSILRVAASHNLEYREDE